MKKAKVLDGFEFSKGGGWRSKYPWDEWLDGKIRVLVVGEHIKNIHSGRMCVHNAAKRHGKRLRTAKDSDGNLVIQAYKEES